MRCPSWDGVLQTIKMADGKEKKRKLRLPAPLKAVSANKLVSVLVVWLIGNVISSAYLSNGAFEIWYQDRGIDLLSAEPRRSLPLKRVGSRSWVGRAVQGKTED